MSAYICGVARKAVLAVVNGFLNVGRIGGCLDQESEFMSRTRTIEITIPAVGNSWIPEAPKAIWIYCRARLTEGLLVVMQ